MSKPEDDSQQQQRESITKAYSSFIHNGSLAMLILSPILIILPPRKLDLYTFFLTGAFITSANQLKKERTGFGLLSGFQKKNIMMNHNEIDNGRLLEEKKKIIIKDDWKEKRLKEEQEKLDQGEGYGNMIMDQVWDVWNWGEKKVEGIQEKDKDVIQTRIKDEQRAREFPRIGKD